ncbi:hypothetical protein MMC26_003736 [Xylographa opegraphella]|nr:hypothetical protein [Xylographa opegraphella]
MGGFAIETDEPGNSAYIPGSPRLTLTANGLVAIAQAGHLPDISITFIQDKSTQNSLAKTLAIFQGSWFLLQIIGRLVDELPISLLEIHTAAHALCALLVYYLWWDKPYDVEDAIVLTGNWVRPLAAALWMFSYNDSSKETVRGIGKRHSRLRPPEIEGMLHYESNPTETTNPGVANRKLGASEPTLIELQNLPSSTTTPSQPCNCFDKAAETLEGHDRPPVHSSDQVQVLKLLNLGTYAIQPIEHQELENIKDGEVLLPFGFGPNTTSKTFHAFQ